MSVFILKIDVLVEAENEEAACDVAGVALAEQRSILDFHFDEGVEVEDVLHLVLRARRVEALAQ